MSAITQTNPNSEMPCIARALRVSVFDSGVSNLASILAALRRLGAEPEAVQSAGAISAAERLVLPGVGGFGAAVAAIDGLDLRAVLRARLEQGQPTLAICLGMQLLAHSSEEATGQRGLGLWPLAVTRFPKSVAVPQLGWNSVRADSGAGCLSDGHFYFANSYRLTSAPPGWRAAWADHGGPFVAALERGAILACQFHPELSGQAGSLLLSRWLQNRPSDVLLPC
jgi:imidazole glycerol phosphate synthase glutamine amidotransferase subunit